MSRSDIETDRMIDAVNDNHREACRRAELAGYERRLSGARRQAVRAASGARVAERHRKLNLTLLLALCSRCAIGAVEAGLVDIWLGLGVAAAGMTGVIWLAGGLWQEFKYERSKT